MDTHVRIILVNEVPDSIPSHIAHGKQQEAIKKKKKSINKTAVEAAPAHGLDDDGFVFHEKRPFTCCYR